MHIYICNNNNIYLYRSIKNAGKEDYLLNYGHRKKFRNQNACQSVYICSMGFTRYNNNKYKKCTKFLIVQQCHSIS